MGHSKNSKELQEPTPSSVSPPDSAWEATPGFGFTASHLPTPGNKGDAGALEKLHLGAASLLWSEKNVFPEAARQRNSSAGWTSMPRNEK